MDKSGNTTGNLILSYRCRKCGHKSSIPFEFCLKCQSSDISEEETKGTGVVASFTVQHIPGRNFVDDVPYTYVVVRLGEGPLISGFVGESKSEGQIKIGQKVRISGTRGRAPLFEVY